MNFKIVFMYCCLLLVVRLISKLSFNDHSLHFSVLASIKNPTSDIRILNDICMQWQIVKKQQSIIHRFEQIPVSNIVQT